MQPPETKRCFKRLCVCVHVSVGVVLLLEYTLKCTHIPVAHNRPLISAHKQLSFKITKQLGPKPGYSSHSRNFLAASKQEESGVEFFSGLQESDATVPGSC